MIWCRLGLGADWNAARVWMARCCGRGTVRAPSVLSIITVGVLREIHLARFRRGVDFHRRFERFIMRIARLFFGPALCRIVGVSLLIQTASPVRAADWNVAAIDQLLAGVAPEQQTVQVRSEERRVGKECRSR